MSVEAQIQITRTVLALKHGAGDQSPHGNRVITGEVWLPDEKGSPTKKKVEFNAEQHGYTVEVWRNKNVRSWVSSLRYRGDEIFSNYHKKKNQSWSLQDFAKDILNDAAERGLIK